MFSAWRPVAVIPALLAFVARSNMDTSSAIAGAGATASTVRPDPDQKARNAYKWLIAAISKAATLRLAAAAVLVFPSIVEARLLVGAQGGDEVRIDPNGKVRGYYNLTALPYGVQAGTQSFSQAMFQMTSAALDPLNKSDCWSVGDVYAVMSGGRS